MSLTQWLTRSAPQVSCRPIAIATFSFVPDAVGRGDEDRLAILPEKSGRKSPPKPPTSPSTPGVNVERIAFFARASAAAFASMSTPASAYREVIEAADYRRAARRARGRQNRVKRPMSSEAAKRACRA